MTISGRKKRVLKYVNEKNKTERHLIVGPKGGVSYKPPNSNTRRYVSSICKKIDCSKSFWDEVKKVLPEYKNYRKWLRLNSYKLYL